MCLQTLAEFAGPGLPVVLAGARGEVVETTLGALLPHGFGRAFLARGAARLPRPRRG
jgi:cytidine deaminase